MTAPTLAPSPARGQLWAKGDPDAGGRLVRIVAVDQSHATAEPVPTSGVRPAARLRIRIRLAVLRAGADGWRYVPDATP